MKHKIEIPEGCKAKVSQENGCLIIEVESEFKRGDVLTINYGSGNWMFIPVDYNCINDFAFDYILAYASTIDELFFANQMSNYSKTQIKKATKEESELLHSKLADAGLKYNPETHKVEQLGFKAGDVLVNEYENNRKIIFIPQNDFIIMPKKLDCICAVNGLDYFYVSNIVSDFKYKLTRYATLKEIQKFFDRIDEEGYEYNLESKSIEKKRWKPRMGGKYYTPCSEYVGDEWNDSLIQKKWYYLGLVFKTQAESYEAGEKIKQMFAK